MNKLILLVFCHLVGDYVLQNDFIAKNKGSNWYHLFVHCALYCLPFYDFRNIAFLVYICYNASRQWNKYLHIQRKPQRVAFSGVFYSVKWFNLLGWLPYSSPSSHLQI